MEGANPRRAMKLLLGLALVCGLSGTSAIAQECGSIVESLKLPVKVKTKGKPKRMRWDQVNRLLPELRKAVQGRSCRLTFAQVFTPKKERPELYFPLLGSVLQTAPEKELEGLPVFYLDGYEAGTFSNRVIFQRNGRNDYYFQFKSKSGRLEASRRYLLDIGENAPVYLVRWRDISNRALIVPSEEVGQ